MARHNTPVWQPGPLTRAGADRLNEFAAFMVAAVGNLCPAPPLEGGWDRGGIILRVNVRELAQQLSSSSYPYSQIFINQITSTPFETVTNPADTTKTYNFQIPNITTSETWIYPTALPTGNNQVLSETVSGGVVTLAWAAASPLTTKGDLFTFDTANQRLPVGNNTFLLLADSSQATGLVWQQRLFTANLPTTPTVTFGGAVPTNGITAWYKITVGSANLGATGVAVTLCTIPAGGVIVATKLNATTQFTGGGATSVVFQVKSHSTPPNFTYWANAGVNWNTQAVNTPRLYGNIPDGSDNQCESQTGAATIDIVATYNGTGLTAGSLDVYLLVGTAA